MTTLDANVPWRPAGQRGQHLAGLVGVVVDRLLAEDHQARLFLLDDPLQDLRHGQRLGHVVGLDQDAAVGAHGERGADRLLRLLRTDGHRDDLGHRAGFLQPDCLFNRDLVERVHAHLHIGEFDAGPVRLHANLHIVVDHPFDRHQDFHSRSTPVLISVTINR
jgi:hypothetical protein